jgi:hypothetical protein
MKMSARLWPIIVLFCMAPEGALMCAYRQAPERLKAEFVDLGEKALKNIARSMGVYAIKSGSEGAGPANVAN